MVGAVLRSPGQIDLSATVFPVQRDGRSIFDRPFAKAALLEQRADSAGNAEPAHDAIKGVPSMIEQYSAAGDSRIGAPVRPIGRDGDCRLRAQGLPANCPHGSDRHLLYERQNTLAIR